MPEKLTISQLRKKRAFVESESMDNNKRSRRTISGKSYFREHPTNNNNLLKYYANEARKIFDPDNAEWKDPRDKDFYDTNFWLRSGKYENVVEYIRRARAKRFEDEFGEYPISRASINYTKRIQQLEDLRRRNNYLIEHGKLDKDTTDYSELDRYYRLNGRFYELRNNALKQRYLKDIELLKKEFAKRIIVNADQRQSAQRCLDLIRKYDKKVVRFENLGIVLSNLGKEDSFAGKESMISDQVPLVYNGAHSPISTKGLINYDVDRLTGGFGSLKYTSAVFFQQAAFDHEQQHGHDNWGTIRDLGINTMLGIQVLHWDPKVVYQTAKAMLKIRPKDPIVIFDLYGNVFFP